MVEYYRVSPDFECAPLNHKNGDNVKHDLQPQLATVIYFIPIGKESSRHFDKAAAHSLRIFSLTAGGGLIILKPTFIFKKAGIRMAHNYSTDKPARPGWESVAGRFPEGKDCLAAFLALETAEVLSAVKPANLLNIPNRNRSCGRNLYELWQRHGSGLVEAGGLMAVELVDRRDSLLLLLYNPVALAALLAGKGVVAVLRRTGYPDPADMAAALAELQSRLQCGTFPHEIGVFLGYPLKDVLGFMGLAKVQFTCQGPWKSMETLPAASNWRRRVGNAGGTWPGASPGAATRCFCLQDGGRPTGKSHRRARDNTVRSPRTSRRD